MKQNLQLPVSTWKVPTCYYNIVTGGYFQCTHYRNMDEVGNVLLMCIHVQHKRGSLSINRNNSNFRFMCVCCLPSHFLLFYYHLYLPGGLIPYDGVPTEEVVSVHLSLTVIFSILATAGIAFGVVCLAFNFIFRNKKWVIHTPRLDICFNIQSRRKNSNFKYLGSTKLLPPLRRSYYAILPLLFALCYDTLSCSCPVPQAIFDLCQ